jgi:hypothetical protein
MLLKLSLGLGDWSLWGTTRKGRELVSWDSLSLPILCCVSLDVSMPAAQQPNFKSWLGEQF